MLLSLGWHIPHEDQSTITRKSCDTDLIHESKSPSSTNLASPFEHVVPADVEALGGLGVLGTLAGHDGGVAGLANPQGPAGWTSHSVTLSGVTEETSLGGVSGARNVQGLPSAGALAWRHRCATPDNTDLRSRAPIRPLMIMGNWSGSDPNAAGAAVEESEFTTVPMDEMSRDALCLQTHCWHVWGGHLPGHLARLILARWMPDLRISWPIPPPDQRCSGDLTKATGECLGWSLALSSTENDGRLNQNPTYINWHLAWLTMANLILLYNKYCPKIGIFCSLHKIRKLDHLISNRLHSQREWDFVDFEEFIIL